MARRSPSVTEFLQSEEFCRIVRIVRRKHWFSRQRWGTFVVLVLQTDGERAIARSATFAVSRADIEHIPAFRALLKQLAEEGWEQWHGPSLPFGIDALNKGYWSWTLCRLRTTQDGVIRDLTQWQARNAEEERMAALRAHAIARFRQKGYQVVEPAL